jgi:glycosyltransferase involved in cell wall biosynthesis
VNAIAVSAHPLSRSYAERLEDELGTQPVYVVLSHLRRRPPREIFATLRGFAGADCLLPLEDATSAVLLPLLEAVVVAFRPRSIKVLDPELRSRPISRLAAVPSLAAVAAATVDGVASVRRARRDLDELLVAPRVRARFADNPQRILYVNGNLWFGVKAGGSVGHIAGVVGAFVDSGATVDLLAAAETAQLDNVSFHPLRPPGAFALPPEVNTYRIQRRLAAEIEDLSRRRGATLLYQRLSLGTYAGARAARALGIPYVVEYNGSEAWVQEHWGRGLHYPTLARDAERATLRHAHLVVTVSDVLRNDLLERGVPADRIVVYPNCVDAAMFDPARFSPEATRDARRAQGVPADSFVVTFVGTFGQWHGVDVLAQAIRHLLDEKRSWLESHRVHFMLVGDGLRMPEVRAILGDADEHITFTGLVQQHDTPGLLAASDLLMSPHVRNADGTPFFGSPTKLFEYMAMERPIIASRLDQIAEVLSPALDAAKVSDGDDSDETSLAVLTTPGSVEELVAALQFLVPRERVRIALGRRARRRVLERYTWRHHVAAIYDGVERVAGLEGGDT